MVSDKKYVMALDAGTSSNRAIIFDRIGAIVSIGQREFPQIYPKPGWVEHNPDDIWTTMLAVAREAIQKAGISPSEISAIGIANQRETTVIWDRKTGRPVANALVWQDRRTASIVDNLKSRGLGEYVTQNTGLVLDAYFSGTKIQWILDNTPGARERAERGELAFGTVDSWLIWNLTGGVVHVTDCSNASRTLLYNIKTLQWDGRLLAEMNVPSSILPDVRATSEIYGTTSPALFDGVAIPVAASAGDQQAALFGQACFEAGMVKCTYGTGASLMMNTGSEPIRSDRGLLTTVGWKVDGKVEYALEGLLFTTGSAVQWLRDELKIIHDSRETELSASKVPDTNGVYFVPAFTGLSAPYWDQYSRGTIVGITRGANRDHLIRATLESMAYQIRDVIDCMEVESGIKKTELKVDGGACKNNFTMQFQADMLGVRVLRPVVVDTTARGAAFLAGLATGFWKDREEIGSSAFALDREFTPQMSRAESDRLYAGWLRAVDRSRDWIEHG